MCANFGDVDRGWDFLGCYEAARYRIFRSVVSFRARSSEMVSWDILGEVLWTSVKGVYGAHPIILAQFGSSMQSWYPGRSNSCRSLKTKYGGGGGGAGGAGRACGFAEASGIADHRFADETVVGERRSATFMCICDTAGIRCSIMRARQGAGAGHDAGTQGSCGMALLSISSVSTIACGSVNAMKLTGAKPKWCTYPGGCEW